MAGEIKKVQFSEGLNVDTPADIPFTADDFTGIMPTSKGGTGVNGSAVFPTSGTVATTADITAAFEGKKFKDPVVVATASNITLSGEQTIDGVLTSSSRVLVKSQSAPAENGIYVSAAGAWSRASDANTWDELTSAIVSVERGTSYSDTGWFCIANSGGTLGTTAIVWEQKFGTGAIDLTSDVTGLLPIGNGGTNASNAADAYDNLSPASAKGDIVSHNGTGAEVLAVGANGKVLGANSAQASGLEWVDAATLPIDLTTDVTGALPLGNGGTGQTTANAALNALLPSQTSNSGKVLGTDGSNTSWVTSATVPFQGYVYSDGTTLQRVAAFSGNANRVPGIDAAATGVEYKAITAAVAGSTVGVSHSAGSIQIQVPQASSSAYGLVSPYNTGSIVHAEEFTPTYTNSSNTSNYSHISGIYERVGGFVFMNGRCTIDTAGTTIRFFLSLPIASNLSTSAHLNGSFVVVPPTGSYVNGYIVPDTTNDRADLTATSVGTHTTVNIYYRFVYKII